jgi:Bax protein
MRIEQLARTYRVDLSLPVEQQLNQLLIKVDIIPPGLVLAQAANESGWGSSRFSQEVNNLFGEWTYNPESGVLPANRPEGADHYVRRFDSLRASVRSYMQNLNSGQAYTLFRRLRADMRQKGKPLDPIVLAEGLKRYSARGGDYISEIQAMIRHNDLNSLGQLDLVR